MFRSIPWKRTLVGIGLVVIGPIALAMASGMARRAKSSPFAEKTVLEDSEAPAQARSILQRACKDCHSDQTAWPWYADLPPVSWQIHGDVARGREFMNLSKWSEYSEAQRRGFTLAIAAATKARLMPPPKYVWMHGNAKLSDADLKELERWALAATRASSQRNTASLR